VKQLPGFLLSLALAWIGLGCAGASSRAPDYPDWVTAPPADNEQWLFGVGESPNREASRYAALASIASRIATQIRSTTTIEQHQDGGGFSEQFGSYVNARVKDTGLSHFKVQEAVRVGTRWAVLLRVSLPELIAANRSGLARGETALNQHMQRLENESDLARYLASRSIREQIAQCRAHIAILNAVGASPDTREAFARYRGYENQLASSRQQLRFRVSANPSAQPFGKQLANQLSQAGLSTRIGKPEPDAVTVTLAGEVRERKDYDRTQIRLTVSVATRDDEGRVFSRIQHEAEASSVHGYATALEKASEMLENHCAEQGAIACLGWQQGDNSF
jgi:hypothetical protein